MPCARKMRLSRGGRGRAMPLPQAVLQLTGSPGFWADYLFLEDGPGEEYPALDGARVDLDVCPGYRLTLGLDRHLSYHGLRFAPPGGDEPGRDRLGRPGALAPQRPALGGAGSDRPLPGPERC